MPKLRTLFGICMAVIFFVLVAPSYFVWLPDVITQRENVIRRMDLGKGCELLVTQQWNNSDFYTTLLSYRALMGKSLDYVIDGDDRKRWHCDMRWTNDGQNIEISFARENTGEFSLKSLTFQRTGGVIQAGDPHQ